MTDRLAWGILGTGSIARIFSRGVAAGKTGKLIAVGSRSQAGADKFADEFSIPHRHGSYEALLANKEVQAVYIATPHPLHAQWAIAAARAGKHLLVEKPLGLNAAEAAAIIQAAKDHDVFLMEAFMYRCHPQTARLVELIREKVIGQIGIVQATFSFRGGDNPESRLLANSMGGGGILDVGCYCMSMARLIAGAATGKNFADPLEVKGSAKLHDSTGADEYAVASVKFPGGILAELATGIRLNQENVVRIFGSEGSILIPSPWTAAYNGGSSKIIVNRQGEKEPREIVIDEPRGLYTVEADLVAANIDRRQAPAPAMTWDDTLENMRALDQWRQSAGVIYEQEKAQMFPPFIAALFNSAAAG